MLNLKHGGHVLANDATGAQDVAKKMDVVVLPKGDRPTETPFDYLFPQLKGKPDAHLPGDPAKVVADLKALGAAMVDTAPGATANPPGDDPKDIPVPVNSIIPAIYTYWGQFIDHDTTANTDRDSKVSDITRPDLTPVPADEVTRLLKNLRRPNLDLDSLYGNGPALMDSRHNDDGMYVGPRFRLGDNANGPGIPGVKIPPEADLHRDLPRIGPLLDAGVITMADVPESLRTDPNLRTRAFVGDLRNDENLLVAQLHTAFLRFHNAVVDRLAKKDNLADKVLFRRAQKLVRYHYQWLVVNDYLRTVTLPGVVDKVLTAGPKHYKPLHGHELFMPLEYSVAAFRFGHSMVRGGYDHNRNFGKHVPGQTSFVAGGAAFNLLFLFTGNGFAPDPVDPTKSTRNPFLGQPTLPFNWIIEFDRFTNKADPDETHFARKIDTRIVPPITQMVNEGNAPGIQDDAGKPIRQLLRHLGQRNLVRGYLLNIPTGQAVAAELGVVPLSEAELQQGNTPAVNAALAQGGFLQRTPLWYYVLKEAEVRANGNSLGEVGSRIVCETLIGVLRNDPDSYLNVPTGWDPSDGITMPNGDPITTIRDLLAFTGVPV